MHDFLIGRQQILDRDQNPYAYELLFRDAQGQGPLAFGLTAASNQVIVDSLLEQGLDRVVGKHRAFINFTRENLLSGTALLLPRDKVVIEVLESVEVDDTLIEAVRQLAAAGYCIALDDFVLEPSWLPLVELAHIIKIDLRSGNPEANRALVKSPLGHSIRFLAEKVETMEEYLEYRDLGCHYFQGYFFSKPHVVRGKRLESSRPAVLRILAKINEPDLTVKDLVNTVSLDVGLSYKLLRYINSASFSLSRKVDSLQQAVLLLGLREIRRWTSLIALASFPSKSPELINTALIRARMCECLAELAKLGNTDQFFLVGLMSTIDHLLNVPMTDAIAGLPLSAPVKEALLERKGAAGDALDCAVAYERWQLEQASFKTLPLAEIGRIYLESVAWAYESCNGLES